MKRLNLNNNKNEYWEVASNYQYRTTEATAKAEPTKTEVNTKTETKPIRKKRKVLWNRVAVASILFAMIVYGGFSAIFHHTIKTDDEVISDESAVKTEVSSTADSDSSSRPIEKPVLITLSDEEFETLVLAVQHECGKDPMLYLTLAEKEEYYSLSESNQDDQQKKFVLEEKAESRFNTCQQLTAAAMLNRINKPGFGVEAESTYGAKAKDLLDVLSQEGQYKSEDENLLEDISHYSTLSCREQFDPCDARTINNLKQVIFGDVEPPRNLFYQVSWYLDPGDDPEIEAEKALRTMVSESSALHVYEFVQNSYGGLDYIMVFGTNDRGDGYGG